MYSSRAKYTRPINPTCYRYNALPFERAHTPSISNIAIILYRYIVILYFTIRGYPSSNVRHSLF